VELQPRFLDTSLHRLDHIQHELIGNFLDHDVGQPGVEQRIDLGRLLEPPQNREGRLLLDKRCFLILEECGNCLQHLGGFRARADQ
jgi:hypothetical protein